MSWYAQPKVDLLARSTELLESAKKLAEQDSPNATEVAALLLEIDQLRFTSINALNQWHTKLVTTIHDSNPKNINGTIKANLDSARYKLLKKMPKEGVSGFTQFSALENVDNIFLTHFLGEASPSGSSSSSSPSRSRGSSVSFLTRTPSPYPTYSPPPTPPASPLKNYSGSSSNTTSSNSSLTSPRVSTPSPVKSSSPPRTLSPSTWLSPPNHSNPSFLSTSTEPSTISLPLFSSTAPTLTELLTIELPSHSSIPSPSPLISPPRQYSAPMPTSFAFTSNSPTDLTSTSLPPLSDSLLPQPGPTDPIVSSETPTIPLGRIASPEHEPGAEEPNSPQIPIQTHIPPSKSIASSPVSTPSPIEDEPFDDEASDPVEPTQPETIPKSRSYPTSPASTSSEELEESDSPVQNKFSAHAIEKMVQGPGVEETPDLVVPAVALVRSSSETSEDGIELIVDLEVAQVILTGPLEVEGMRTVFFEPTAITITNIAGFFDGRDSESISIDVNEYLFSMPFPVRDNVYKSVLKGARQSPEDLLWAYNHIADDCTLLLNVLLKELPYIPMSLHSEDQLTFAQMRDALFNIRAEEEEPAAQADKINALLEKMSDKTRQDIYEEVFEKSTDRSKESSLEWVQAHIADNWTVLWNAVIRTTPVTISAATSETEMDEEEDSTLISCVLTWVYQTLYDKKLSAEAINKRIKELLMGISRSVYNIICLEILQKHRIVKKDINLQWVEAHLASSQQILINALIKHVPCVQAGSFLKGSRKESQN